MILDNFCVHPPHFFHSKNLPTVGSVSTSMQSLIRFTVLALLAVTASGKTPKEVTEFINHEMVCRQAVLDGNEYPFFIAAGGLLALSIAFLVVSVVLFVCLIKKASKQVNAAQEKAHLVMDAVLVALIPVEVLKGLGAFPDEKKLAEKEKKNSKKTLEAEE